MCVSLGAVVSALSGLFVFCLGCLCCLLILMCFFSFKKCLFQCFCLFKRLFALCCVLSGQFFGWICRRFILLSSLHELRVESSCSEHSLRKFP